MDRYPKAPGDERTNVLNVGFITSVCPLTTNPFPFSLPLQDRHIKKNSVDGDPVVDPSQDYFLLHGYENATHTVLRFKRKLDTCDTANDVPITVSCTFHFSTNDKQFVTQTTECNQQSVT